MSDYNDDDLVYIDPKKKVIVGHVTWDKNGNPQPMEWKEEISVDTETDDDAKPKKRRSRKKRYYPWGSYKTAKKLYNIEGKYIEEESNKPFDDILQRALKEPFWDS